MNELFCNFTSLFCRSEVVHRTHCLLGGHRLFLPWQVSLISIKGRSCLSESFSTWNNDLCRSLFELRWIHLALLYCFPTPAILHSSSVVSVTLPSPALLLPHTSHPELQLTGVCKITLTCPVVSPHQPSHTQGLCCKT